jgi:hypothetical protein
VRAEQHCIDGQAGAANKRINDALAAQDTQPELGDEEDGDSEQAVLSAQPCPGLAGPGHGFPRTTGRMALALARIVWRTLGLRAGHSCVSQHRVKPIQLASGTGPFIGNVNSAGLAGNPLDEFQVLAGMASLEALQQRLHEKIGARVAGDHDRAVSGQ